MATFWIGFCVGGAFVLMCLLAASWYYDEW